MKATVTRALRFVSVLYIAFCFESAVAAQALLIGVSAYPESPLANPPNDVRLLSASLDAKGWKSRTLLNPTSRQLRDNLREFLLEQRGSMSPVLIYFSGHGLQYKGENYLLPTDVLSSRRPLASAVSISEISQMASAVSAPKIFIIDACRNSPLGRETVSVSTGLNSQYAPPNTLIAYATAPGEVALDGVQGSNSPYAKALALSIDQHDSLDAAFKRTRLETMRLTGGKQLPWESSSLYQEVALSYRLHSQQASHVPSAQTVPYVSVPATTNQGTQNTANNSLGRPTATVISSPIKADSFLAAIDSLRDAMAASHLSAFSRRDGTQSTERDRADFLASMDLLKRRINSEPAHIVYRLINALQTGIMYPNCRKGSGIDANCGDFDRHFAFTPSLEVSLQLSKVAQQSDIRADLLANHYANGWGLEKNLVRAYELYESDRRRAGTVAHYWWTNVNQMMQRELSNMGYSVSIDGDFGAASCAALTQVIGKTQCARVITRSQVQDVVTKARAYVLE